MPLVDGPDCRLWVETHGSGDPVTVFAHGITSSVAELRAMAARTPGTRVLFDFRGHGSSDSPPPEAGYDHAAMRRDLEHVANAFGATQAFGVSMGAGAIMNLLADQPDRFERLVFFIPASIDEPNAGATGFEEFAALLEERPLEEVARIVTENEGPSRLFELRPWWRRIEYHRVLRMNATGVPRALRAYTDGRPPLADGSVLRKVTAPTLILSHEQDPVHDAAVARRLGELMPNAAVRIWDEPLAMLDDWNVFARTVGAFLGGAPATRAAGTERQVAGRDEDRHAGDDRR